VFDIVELHTPQLNRVILAGVQASQHDCLIATQTRALMDRLRAEAPILQIGFCASDEKSLGLMQHVESGEIDIPPTRRIAAARLEDQQVEDIHVVQLTIRDVDERKDVASQVEQYEQYEQFDCALFLACGSASTEITLNTDR